MNIHHLKIVRSARSLARSLGILNIINSLRPKAPYEDKFHKGMVAAVRPGDVVWDIGANIGLYTTQFAEWVGSEGRVIAFEPLPAAVAKLTSAVLELRKDAAPVQICQVALSDAAGQMQFEVVDVACEEVTTISRILEGAASGQAGRAVVQVEVQTADGVQSGKQLPVPRVTKIDVEGFEEDVLLGGQKTFGSPESREIFVEVHFTRIDERGKGDAPARMVQLLKSWGYKVKWLDASHLHATRAFTA